MIHNNAPQTEHGWSMVLRSLDHLWLRANGGTNDLNAGAESVTADSEGGADVLAELAALEAAFDASLAALGTMSAQNANAVAITGGSIVGITDLAVADGGTGQSSIGADTILYGTGATTYAATGLSAFMRTVLDDVNAATVLTTIGVGTLGTQGAGAVAITGGSVTGITDLAVADGGTAASTDVLAARSLSFMRLGYYGSKAEYTSGSGTHNFASNSSVFCVIIIAAGGGGGGGTAGGGSNSAAGGGGGGGEIVYFFGKTSSYGIVYSIGSYGAGGAVDTDGGNGVATSATFSASATLYANPGLGGSSGGGTGSGGKGGSYNSYVDSGFASMVTFRVPGQSAQPGRIRSITYGASVTSVQTEGGAGGIGLDRVGTQRGRGGAGGNAGAAGTGGEGGWMMVWEA